MATATAVPNSGPQLDNRRVLAALIDLAVVGVGIAAILAAAGVLGDSPSSIGAPLVAVSLGWALYYYFACESSDSAQTLGKRVMKLRVERLDGGRADMRDIALRTVLRLIDGMFLYLVGLIVMLATGKRRGRVGDLVGGTRIVSVDERAAAPAAAAVTVESEAPRVPIAESGPAFERVAEEEPAVEAEPAAEEELVAEVEDEPVAEVGDEPSEGDTVDMASPALTELAADVEATAGSAPDEEEPVEDEPVAEEEPLDDDLVDDDPLADGDADADADADADPDADPDPDPEAEDGEDGELEPAAEADEDEPAAQVEDESEDEVERIETVSAIDLVMEDSRRKS